MAKTITKEHAYYFRFVAPTWLAATSKIQLLNYEEKGIFIELCAMLLMENGKIKNDEMLHRKLRLEKAKLTSWLNLVSDLNLLVFDGEYLSVKFINEALCEMKERKKIYIENGKKGGRPKTKQNLSSKNQNKNQNNQKHYKKKDKSFDSPQPPVGADDSKLRGNFSENENGKKKGFLFEAWIASGKPEAEYWERLKGELPKFTGDDWDCLEIAGMELNEKTKPLLRKVKAILGADVFSAEVHTLKSRVLEGKAQNPEAYFNTQVKNAIKNMELS